MDIQLTWDPVPLAQHVHPWILGKVKLAITMHYTAFVLYSVTAGCSLSDNTHRLLPVLCCPWLPSEPGMLPRATKIVVLLGICYDPILLERPWKCEMLKC